MTIIKWHDKRDDVGEVWGIGSAGKRKRTFRDVIKSRARTTREMEASSEIRFEAVSKENRVRRRMRVKTNGRIHVRCIEIFRTVKIFTGMIEEKAFPHHLRVDTKKIIRASYCTSLALLTEIVCSMCIVVVGNETWSIKTTVYIRTNKSAWQISVEFQDLWRDTNILVTQKINY